MLHRSCVAPIYSELSTRTCHVVPKSNEQRFEREKLRRFTTLLFLCRPDLFFAGEKLLETRIVPKWIERRIESKQRRSQRDVGSKYTAVRYRE
jgi:hypothetical protein